MTKEAIKAIETRVKGTMTFTAGTSQLKRDVLDLIKHIKESE